MNKRVLFALLFLLMVAGCSKMNFGNVGGALDAGTDLFKAASLSDQEVQTMALQFSKESDRTNKIAPAGSKYSKRLATITKGMKNEDGLKLDFKAYIDPEMNAFALANGSVRVYSGLMDKMTDDEVRFVLGHEIGHVKEGHSKEKTRMAYATSAARKGVAMSNSTAGTLAASEVGGLLEAVVNAQFSQKEESAADDYGLGLMKKHKYNAKAAPTALRKLAEGGSGGSSFLSTHPDPETRAKKLEKLI